MMKALPLAIENFPDLIRQGGYYVDKTAFIQPLMTEGKTVRLITRPHCFGKTLFMDMLKSFLQIDWQHPRSAEGHCRAEGHGRSGFLPPLHGTVSSSLFQLPRY